MVCSYRNSEYCRRNGLHLVASENEYQKGEFFWVYLENEGIWVILVRTFFVDREILYKKGLLLNLVESSTTADYSRNVMCCIAGGQNQDSNP